MSVGIYTYIYYLESFGLRMSWCMSSLALGQGKWAPPTHDISRHWEVAVTFSAQLMCSTKGTHCGCLCHEMQSLHHCKWKGHDVWVKKETHIYIRFILTMEKLSIFLWFAVIFCHMQYKNIMVNSSWPPLISMFNSRKLYMWGIIQHWGIIYKSQSFYEPWEKQPRVIMKAKARTV